MQGILSGCDRNFEKEGEATGGRFKEREIGVDVTNRACKTRKNAKQERECEISREKMPEINRQKSATEFEMWRAYKSHFESKREEFKEKERLQERLSGNACLQ